MILKEPVPHKNATVGGEISRNGMCEQQKLFLLIKFLKVNLSE